MPIPPRARVLVAATVTCGSAVLAVAATRTGSAPLTTAALLAVGAILTELVQVPSDESSPDPVDTQKFSFSSGVHIAAVLMLGPWLGALIAVIGVVVVDRLRREPVSHVAYNASVFALAACSGGYAFAALGGTSGELRLPGQFGAVLALWLTYTTVNFALITLVVAWSAALPLRALAVEKVRAEQPSALAEAGLGVTLAMLALREPWAVVALAPVVWAVYQALARLALLRRETARALETFANVVDERDPYTYRHSARVAEYVRELAEGLGLPSQEVRRLRLAGRLHDLGKISVDAAVLRKPGRLDAEEWTAMRRHPRLSARLLRSFRFAAGEARAVEYHHERFDGSGYYGIDGETLPPAAHFLIVADTFDAMTSDRPYRRALGADEALAEIERNAGAQFHPAVAKAFAASRRGLDPREVLEADELAFLRTAASPRRLRRDVVARALFGHPELVAIFGIVLALLGAAATAPALGLAGLAIAAAGLSLHEIDRLRAHRLAASLREAGDSHPRRDLAFAAVADRLAAAVGCAWTGLLIWREHELGAYIDLEHGDVDLRPSDAALTSWLLRESDRAPAVTIVDGAELGVRCSMVFAALRDAGRLRGFLVCGLHGVPRHLPPALEATASELASLVAARLAAAPPPEVPIELEGLVG